MADTDDSILHPIVTLNVSITSGENGSRVSSLCFLSKQTDEPDSSDDEDDMVFRSQQLLTTTKKVQHTEIPKWLLASCHTNGDAYIWDLQSKRAVQKFPSSSNASGLAIRRVDGNKLAYQKRDGTISIFGNITADGTCMEKILEWNTMSQGFCAMAISKNEDHIVAIPSSTCECTIRDVRQSVAAQELLTGDKYDSNSENCLAHFEAGKGHGMLMSLAMCHSIVVCGMEDGTVCFHDWRKAEQCPVKLSQHFILGLDLAQSVSGSMVAIAGMAGNAEDLENLPESDQGTVAVIKCVVEPSLHARLRSRIGTCSIGGGGKPGVDVGRFRPDGRLFAIGGWDKRVRLFDRSCGKVLAVFKGHTGSVTTLDWATNSMLASGDNDGTIHIWHASL